MTDEAREAILKDALYEHYEARRDLAFHKKQIADIAQALTDATERLTNITALRKTEIPAPEAIMDAAEQCHAAVERLDEAEKTCRQLGLRDGD